MIELRPSLQRGYAEHGWLKSFHSFSFADYYDPQHVQFGNLRVINEDWIAPGMGFGTHPHRDMEIVTYVLEGALAHKDSLGNGAAILPGEVQRMSAGTGIAHSEYNHSRSETTHLLQIWIHPSQRGVMPGYEQKAFGTEEKRGRLRLVASPDGEQGSVSFSADAKIYAGLFDGSESADLAVPPGRLVYVHLAKGELTVNGQALKAGDALKMADESMVHVSKGQDAEVLVFELAA
ncbi:MAG: pirin family protein [Burkholderiaceae bacterium]|jgi:redox-sensitive bicupin YhaK (pirin superfamily)